MTTPHTALVEALRPQFEAYFLSSRKSKGASRAPSFARLPDGTYADDHTQRHWWTYQQAVPHARAALAQAEAAQPALCTMGEQFIGVVAGIWHEHPDYNIRQTLDVLNARFPAEAAQPVAPWGRVVESGGTLICASSSQHGSPPLPVGALVYALADAGVTL